MLGVIAIAQVSDAGDAGDWMRVIVVKVLYIDRRTYTYVCVCVV